VEGRVSASAQRRLERFRETQRLGNIPQSTYLGKKKEKAHLEPFALSAGRGRSGSQCYSAGRRSMRSRSIESQD